MFSKTRRGSFFYFIFLILVFSIDSAKSSRIERRFSPWDSDLIPPWSALSAGRGGSGAVALPSLAEVFTQPANWSQISGLGFGFGSSFATRKQTGKVVRLTTFQIQETTVGLVSGKVALPKNFNFGPSLQSETFVHYPQGWAGAGGRINENFRLGGGLGLNLLKDGFISQNRNESKIQLPDQIKRSGSLFQLLLGAGVEWTQELWTLAIGGSWSPVYLGGMGVEIQESSDTPQNPLLFTTLHGGGGSWTLGGRARWSRLYAGISAWIPKSGRHNFSQLDFPEFSFEQPYPGWTQAGLGYDFDFLELYVDWRWTWGAKLQSVSHPNLRGIFPSAPFPIIYQNSSNIHIGVELPVKIRIPTGRLRRLRAGFQTLPNWYKLIPARVDSQPPCQNEGDGLCLDQDKNPLWYVNSNLPDGPNGWSGTVGVSGGAGSLNWDLAIQRRQETFIHTDVTWSLDLGFQLGFDMGSGTDVQS